MRLLDAIASKIADIRCWYVDGKRRGHEQTTDTATLLIVIGIAYAAIIAAAIGGVL